MNTLNEIMAIAPITKTNAATKTQVISGTTFWGLTSGQWGVQTGTLTVSGGGTVTTTYIPQTGQTKCYDTAAEIACGNVTYPGQDGDYQKGVAWPDPRFITSTTGIVTDTLTGLIWLQDANCILNEYSSFDPDGRVSWTNALTFVFKINDGTYPNCGAGFTDWRLPNVRELSSLTHFEFSDLAVPNTDGTAQWTTNGDPFNSVQSDLYWSGSTYANITSFAWYVSMNFGRVYRTSKTGSLYVWPVRGGQ